MPTSVYRLLQQMDADNVIVAYKGPVSEKLLESIYEMMDRHLEETKTPADKKKKLFHVLIESLQNVFHHHPQNLPFEENGLLTGFVIKYEDDIYRIITGNHVLKTGIKKLTEKLEKVNSLSPAELRIHYQQSLATTELSDKGGAGLGIIEMARKSGRKLNYEFTSVNDEYSFFTLEVTI